MKLIIFISFFFICVRSQTFGIHRCVDGKETTVSPQSFTYVYQRNERHYVYFEITSEELPPAHMWTITDETGVFSGSFNYRDQKNGNYRSFIPFLNDCASNLAEPTDRMVKYSISSDEPFVSEVTYKKETCESSYSRFLDEIDDPSDFPKGVIDYNGEKVNSIAAWDSYTFSYDPILSKYSDCTVTLIVRSENNQIIESPFKPETHEQLELKFAVQFENSAEIIFDIIRLTPYAIQTKPTAPRFKNQKDTPSINCDDSQTEDNCSLECETREILAGIDEESHITIISTKTCELNELQFSTNTMEFVYEFVLCPEIPSYSLSFDSNSAELRFGFFNFPDFIETTKSYTKCIYELEVIFESHTFNVDLRELNSGFQLSDSLSPGSYSAETSITLLDSDFQPSFGSTTFDIQDSTDPNDPKDPDEKDPNDPKDPDEKDPNDPKDPNDSNDSNDSNSNSSSTTLLIICILIPALVVVIIAMILVIVLRKRFCGSTVYKLDDVLSTTNMTMDDTSMFQTEMM